MTAADDPDRADDPVWAPPAGPAAADPDPTDRAEHRTDTPSAPSPPPTGPPAPVVPLASDPPVAGRPWTVRAQTAAGVSGLSIEIEDRPADVVMHPEPTPRGTSPTWSGTVDDVGAAPLRYRFVWRSSWNGDVTEWLTATPTVPD